MPKCTTPWAASHCVAATFTPEFSVAYSLRGKVRSWWPVHNKTVPPFGTSWPECFTAASRSPGVISARGAMWRRSMHMPGCNERLLVRGPDAVDNRRMARIGRGFVIEFAAEVDDLHGWVSRPT